MAARSWTAEEEELMEAAIAKTKVGDPIDWFVVAEAVGGGRTAQEVETHYEIMIKDFPPFIPTPQISTVSEPSKDSSGSDAGKGSGTHGNGNSGGDGNGTNRVGDGNGNGSKISNYSSDHASTSKLHTGNTTESSSDDNVLSGEESDNYATIRSRLRRQ